MPTQYSELVGRRAKLTVSADWLSGWLEVRINPLLFRRDLYLAILCDGLSNYHFKAEIALFHNEQSVWNANGMVFSNQARLTFGGSDTTWDNTDNPGPSYQGVGKETGLPLWAIQSADNDQLWPDTLPGPDNPLVWHAATNSGYGVSSLAVHRVVAWPLPVVAVANKYAFRFTDKYVGFSTVSASIEVFLACRSHAA